MNHLIKFSTDKIERLARSIETVLDSEDPARVLGADLARLVARIPSDEQVTPGAVARLSLLNDTLCIAERAIKADGDITPDEVSYIAPLVSETQKYLGRFRHVYREPTSTDASGVRSFLEQHAFDGQMFGGRCKGTAWTGLSVCQRATALTGDAHFIDEYRDLVVRMLDDLFGDIGSGGPDDKQAVVAELMRLAPATGTGRDAREVAYCSGDSPEVFHAVAHGNEVFTPDPFDVEEIHAEARATFSRLVDRASSADFGRMLLVKGVAGSGKTHLMRAFRNLVHGEQLGFVAYLQMSTRVTNYARYLLSNVIDSWDRPYWGEIIPEPALTCLSDSLVSDLPHALCERLRDEALAEDELHAVVNQAADHLIGIPRYRSVHPDVLRVMLYLQRRDPPRRARVLKFLRCEFLGAHDRALLGDTGPLDDEHAASRMLAELGRLVAATGQGALVLLVDQLEDIYSLDEAPGRFRLAMDSLRHLTDSVPTSLVVIACLEDFYIQLRSALNKPVLDRLEKDPEPILLTANRSLPEIRQLIAPRLSALFEQQNVQLRADEPLYPFEPAELEALNHQRTRDVLDWCRAHHEVSILGGAIHAPPNVGTFVELTLAPHAPGIIAIEQAWNDYLTTAPAPGDEADKVSLIAWAIAHLWRELPSAPQIQPHVDGTYVEAKLPEHKLGLALCEKSAAGGALGRQIDALARLASTADAIPIVLRSSEYPRPGKNQISEKLKALLQSGGRRIVVTDTEWRRMLALKLFLTSETPSPELDAWLLAERPLLGLGAIREIMNLEHIPESPASVKPPPVSIRPAATIKPASGMPRVSAAPRAGSSPPALEGAFCIGHTRSLNPQPVMTHAQSFVTHAAFLGSTKSGKTTLALNIIEQLLARGVPALMIDRKGDLCTYGSPEFWNDPDDAESAERKQALRERVDVCVYTPGEPKGRALDLSVVPMGLEELPAHERGSIARSAATALGSMMGYRGTQVEQTRLGILGKAIELVGHRRSATPVGIPQLVTLLHDEDPDLVASIGRLDPKHFRALVENLETLRLRYDHLLRSDGAKLSPELLFGLGSDGRRDKTRLTIISTKFLGDNAAIDFWVARLLGEIARWASKSPASSLQAVVFLDEADIYLPATSKPATKEPVLDLLKRGRAAGVGVLLATQSPGDLDYKCRDNIRSWFVGRVAEKTAVDKMKPLLSECRINVSAKLAQAKTGEFFRLEDGEVVELKATQSLMRTAQMTEEGILGAARESRSVPDSSGVAWTAR